MTVPPAWILDAGAHPGAQAHTCVQACLCAFVFVALFLSPDGGGLLQLPQLMLQGFPSAITGQGQHSRKPEGLGGASGISKSAAWPSWQVPFCCVIFPEL